VLGREGADDGILQHLSAAQRAPRLGEDSQALVLFPELGLLQPRMELDLVDGGNHLGGFQQPVQMLRLEVGDADGPDLALAVQGLECAVGLLEQPSLGAWPVDEVHVHVFQPEVDHGRVKGPQRCVIAVVVIPDLGGDEQILAGYARRGHPRAARHRLHCEGLHEATGNAGFVPVHGGRVEVAVAGFQRSRHQIGRVSRRHLVQPETQLVDQHAVVQAEPG
jgi:hypothetical protein